jgi:hypothetical protein
VDGDESDRFDYFETLKLNQDPLENTYSTIRLHRYSKDNPNVAQFIYTLKISNINGHAFRGLCGSNCNEDGDTLLDDLHNLLRASDASPPKPSTSRRRENSDGVPKRFDVTEHTEQKVGTTVCSGDISVSSVAYVISSTAEQLLHGVNCDACKVRLMSQVMISINVFIHFKEFCDTESHLFLEYFRNYGGYDGGESSLEFCGIAYHNTPLRTRLA